MNEAQKHTHLDASRERLTYIRLDTNMAFRRMKTHLFTEIIPSLHAIHTKKANILDFELLLYTKKEKKSNSTA